MCTCLTSGPGKQPRPPSHEVGVPHGEHGDPGRGVSDRPTFRAGSSADNPILNRVHLIYIFNYYININKLQR